MKNVIKLVVLLLTAVSIGQTNKLEGNVNFNDVTLKDLNITVNVKSAEDVKSTFAISDIEELISSVEPNEDLNFEIICEGKEKGIGAPSTLTYRIQGDSNNQKDFLKRLKKVRKAVINYYKNK